MLIQLAEYLLAALVRQISAKVAMLVPPTSRFQSALRFHGLLVMMLMQMLLIQTTTAAMEKKKNRGFWQVFPMSEQRSAAKATAATRIAQHQHAAAANIA